MFFQETYLPQTNSSIRKLLRNFETQSQPPLPSGKELSGFLPCADRVPKIHLASLSKYRNHIVLNYSNLGTYIETNNHSH